MMLNPALSAYLDLLRFMAALAVLAGHMDQDGLSMSWNPLAPFSHDAVVIFFVLSGFIIYHSTTARASSWQQYAVARLSRIYSVALPAVLFCVLLALWLSRASDLNVSRLSNFTSPSVWHTVSSLLFLNQSWMNPADLTLNNPYWSLCYEVWYYAIFGVFFFTSGRQRWMLMAAVGLIAGPAILILLPVWCMGAWLAASRTYESRWRTGLAWLAFLAPIALIVLIRMTALDVHLRLFLNQTVPGFWRLESSQRFVTDYLIGLALCLNIAAFASLPSSTTACFARCRGPLASLAGFSFTLYLFHRPMTQLLGVYRPLAEGPPWQQAALMLALLVACWLISWATERRLGAWRRAFARLLPPGPEGVVPLQARTGAALGP